MPIDERKLQSIITSLDSVKSAYEEKIYDIAKVQTELEAIKITNSGIPVDPGTGMTITDERRQLVYDCCVKEAKKLLA